LKKHPTCGKPHDKRVREILPGAGGAKSRNPTPREIFHGWEAKRSFKIQKGNASSNHHFFFKGTFSLVFGGVGQDFAGNLFLNFQS